MIRERERERERETQKLRLEECMISIKVDLYINVGTELNCFWVVLLLVWLLWFDVRRSLLMSSPMWCQNWQKIELWRAAAAALLAFWSVVTCLRHQHRTLENTCHTQSRGVCESREKEKFYGGISSNFSGVGICQITKKIHQKRCEKEKLNCSLHGWMNSFLPRATIENGALKDFPFCCHKPR